jgi:DNA-binding NarL/FixJ family response regulator
MMQTVQLAVADAVYAEAIREALARSGPWQVAHVDRPDPSQKCVLVLDQEAFDRLFLPLPNPERVVLISHKDPQLLALAWEAGIVSVVSQHDPINTVLLAIMAAALRVAKAQGAAFASGISPSIASDAAPISPTARTANSTKRSKSH